MWLAACLACFLLLCICNFWVRVYVYTFSVFLLVGVDLELKFALLVGFDIASPVVPCRSESERGTGSWSRRRLTDLGRGVVWSGAAYFGLMLDACEETPFLIPGVPSVQRSHRLGGLFAIVRWTSVCPDLSSDVFLACAATPRQLSFRPMLIRLSRTDCRGIYTRNAFDCTSFCPRTPAAPAFHLDTLPD